MREAARASIANMTHLSIVVFLLIAASFASDNRAVELTPAQTSTLDSALNIFVPGDADACCKSLSLSACLKRDKKCPNADRLCKYAAWLASRGAPKDTIVSFLEIRRDCLTSRQVLPIDPKGFPTLGPQNAAVTLVVYFSGGCPQCKFILSVLDSLAFAGVLNQNLRVVAKPFTSGFTDSTLVAAHRIGRFWDLVQALHGQSQRLTPQLLDRLTDSLKIDRKKITSLEKDTVLMGMLTRSRSEGMANGVTLVPAVFINGMRYKGYKDPKWILDAAEYVKESLKEKR